MHQFYLAQWRHPICERQDHPDNLKYEGNDTNVIIYPFCTHRIQKQFTVPQDLLINRCPHTDFRATKRTDEHRPNCEPGRKFCPSASRSWFSCMRGWLCQSIRLTFVYDFNKGDVSLAWMERLQNIGEAYTLNFPPWIGPVFITASFVFHFRNSWHMPTILLLRRVAHGTNTRPAWQIKVYPFRYS